MMSAVLLFIIFVSICVGRFQISPVEVLKIIASKFFSLETGATVMMEQVVWEVRLPRIIAGMIVGGGLAISGASFQGLFRNPLVSPDILGVSAGAGFGAALALLLNFTGITVAVFAFGCGLIAVSLVYGITRLHKSTPTLIFVLSGIIVSAFFTSLISLTKYIADPYDKLPAIVFWLMGSISAVTYKMIWITMPLIVIASAVLLLLRWRLNVLSLGDREARSLGINIRKLRLIVVVCTTIITAAAVCLGGTIGWIGLVTPHLGRIMVGPNHSRLLPVSFLLGASFLLIIDNIARTLTATEIPLGILTGIVGAPFFTYLILRHKVKWL
ncbi:FecCD family ABC transporter permease [Paenibacillus forsythiae]|nr:iron ABC transporter permease [Paenibacillus forsythiae]